MAVTQNTYTGNGSTVLFSFTFPYLETTDIKVSVNGTNTTAYTLANATTIQFNTAPANGAAIRIYRQTDDSALAATFYPGSAIRSADLNENFTQNLYVTQESNNISATATTTANTALTNSNTAISTANSAVSTANTASTNASAAVATANTASTNASAAVSTANTASTNATAAVNTANTASTNASNAVTTANTALSTANTASSNASAAVATANTASSNASAAVSTANTASSNATTAVNTANNALSTANAATATANTASSNATAALNAVAGSLQYTLVANVAGIPGSPVNNQAIEIADSTGIESFSPLTNRPAGFVGDSGLSVRLQYLSAGSSWNWLNYFANNSETRYLKFGGGTITGNLEIGNSGSLSFEGSTANAFETTLAVTDPTADRTITLPDVSGTVVTTGDTGSVTSTMIADGTIVNADVNASAAIAGTKISPDFGSQNVTTTGTVTGASLNPTSSTVPTNGVYLPAANSVAISTNGTGRLFIDSSGRVGVGTSSVTYNFEVAGTSPVIASSGSSSPQVIAIDSKKQFSGLRMSGDVARLETTFFSGAGGGYTPLTFWTSDTERVRITNSGLVGIGSSSPQHPLQVIGGSSSNNNGANTIAVTGTEHVRLKINTPTTGGYRASLVLSSDEALSGTSKEVVISTTGSNEMRFITNGNERAIIDSSGRLGIGTTSASATLTLVANSSAESIRALGRSSDNVGQIFVASNSGTDYGGLRGASDEVRLSTFGALPLTFHTNGGERGRFDTSGRLLVGTSSALTGADSQYAKLTVQGNTAGTTAPGDINLAIGQPTSSVAANNRLGFITFADSQAGQYAQIGGFVDGTPGTNDYPGRLVFSTTADGASSPTERLRITSNGYSKFSTNGTYSGADAHNFYQSNTNNFGLIVGGFGAYTSTVLAAQGTNASATAFNLFEGYYGGNQTTGVGAAIAIRIRGDGNVTNLNNSYGSLSDIKLKENIVDATSQWDDLKALQVRKYNFKEGQTHTQIGLIAQEVELVSPGLVSESPDRDEDGNDLGTVTKSVNYSVLYMKAVKALQEAMERIEQIEAKVAALESA